MKSYFINVLLGLDLLGSAILGGRIGETLSGRAGAAQAQGKLRGKLLAPVINFLFRDKNHCANAVGGDIRRAQAVIADESKVVPFKR
jgi:hypothetical protein